MLLFKNDGSRSQASNNCAVIKHHFEKQIVNKHQSSSDQECTLFLMSRSQRKSRRLEHWNVEDYQIIMTSLALIQHLEHWQLQWHEPLFLTA